MWNELLPALPTDTAKQVNAMFYARKLAPTLAEGALVLDLGCGDGVSLDLFRSVAPTVKWLGVDIETSPEVDARTRSDGEFKTYDGVHIPVDDASVDLMYSRQVFEHVRYPEQLLADICRVLKPGAAFIGSTSHLEPYHSYSYWNFTPFGFKRLVDAAGLHLTEIRPGIDAPTLIGRAYRNNDATMNRWFAEESPLNQEIEQWAKDGNRSVQQTAFRKLSFCGQFCFWVTRPS
jgi:SAM-dependent methyltransferase